MHHLLPLLPRPSRYAGIEDGMIIKNPDQVSLRIALAFPDAYEVGMSYLGHKILYNIVNSQQGWQAERVMAPEKAASEILFQSATPLATIETGAPLNMLDAVGFAITHELCYTDVLHMLDLAQIPLRHENRPESLKDCPVIMAGGGALLGAEPLSPFLDLVMLGDGEEILPQVLRCLEAAKAAGLTRQEFLWQAKDIPGVYVPSLFVEQEDGSLRSPDSDYRPARRIVADLNDAVYPVNQVAPIGAIHNRLALEIARGCTRGCRFCHAGMVYRPVRERTPEKLLQILNEGLDQTGFEEVSFLSLSTGDFSVLDQFWNCAFDRCAKEQISLALPSLRVGSVNENILEKMEKLRRTGCTLAPEAGSQRLRDVINKGITEEQLLDHARMLLKHGWRQVKLYFMIGLPTETDADLDAIVDLCRKTRDAAGPGGPRLTVTCAISPFVPKPFTPFQWEPQIDLAEMQRRINYCRDLFKKEKSLILHWHNPEASHLEGILSRAGRKMADVVEKAYRKGAIFCGWAEFFNLQPWQEAMNECGISSADLIGSREPGQALPWSHLEAGVTEEFLLREKIKAYAGLLTADCRSGPCQVCGSCDLPGKASLLPHCSEKKHIRRINCQKNEDAVLFDNDLAPRKQSRPTLNSSLAQRHSHYRIWHAKLDNYSYLSQLELQAVITRALRRAKLPVAFSQGYHPMPLLSFGRALPVGVQSEVEWFGLTLYNYMAPQKIMAGLNIFLPGSLAVNKVELVEKKQKTAQSIAEVFELKFVDEHGCAEYAHRVANFAELDRFLFVKQAKKTEKTYDLRPMLLSWQKEDKKISFTLDWSEEYISPLLISKIILNLPESGWLKNIDLIKVCQIFENGSKYCHAERPVRGQ